MKTLFLSAAALGLSLAPVAASAATQTYVCAMQDTASRPYLTFIVTVFGKDDAQIRYVRSAFFGSEEVQFEQDIESCKRGEVQTAAASANKLDVECAGDGDGGFLSVKRSGSSEGYRGSMTFPNTGVEGFDDTTIPVGCFKQQ